MTRSSRDAPDSASLANCTILQAAKERHHADECFRVKGRTTWYMVPEEIHRYLDVFIAFYNEQRTHQGYRLKGRTPAEALREALGVERLPAFAPPASQPEAEEDTMPAETT